jgi:hypothetical protein
VGVYAPGYIVRLPSSFGGRFRQTLVPRDVLKVSEPRKQVPLYICSDEEYPVYHLSERSYFTAQKPIALSAEELSDYEEVLRRYEEWQSRLRKLSGDDER